MQGLQIEEESARNIIAAMHNEFWYAELRKDGTANTQAIGRRDGRRERARRLNSSNR